MHLNKINHIKRMNKLNNLLFLLFISFISVTISINSHKSRRNYRCGNRKYEDTPTSAKNFIDNEYSQPLYLRQLEEADEDGFKKFNIYIDTINIEEEIDKNEDLNDYDYKEMIINSLNKAKSVFETLLKVKVLDYDYYFKDEEIKQLNINNWNKTILGTSAYNEGKTMKSLGIDLIIFPRLADNDELDEEVLSHAIPIKYDNKTAQPLIGIININKNIDLGKEKSQEFLDSIMIHEFIHILGFTPFYLNYFNYVFTRENAYKVNFSIFA